MAALSFPGRLFVVEGVDGAGKSTQLDLLDDWLSDQGYDVERIAWRSPPDIKDLKKKDRKDATKNTTSFSLLYAADLADKTQDDILPALKAGSIMLADRYMYTAFARDVARGLDKQWVRQVYSFALKPNLAFYFRIPLDMAMQRILDNRGRLGFYEAGMDLKLSKDPQKSFGKFQARIMAQYESMVPEFGLKVIDATQSVAKQQAQLQAIITPYLAGLQKKGA